MREARTGDWSYFSIRVDLWTDHAGYRVTMQKHTTTTGHTFLSGRIEKLDFTRRQISLRVGRKVTTLRSRKPLNLPGIRLGDTIHVALDEDGTVFFGKPHA